MERLYSKITFTNKNDDTGNTEVVFDFVNEVKIRSSYETLTDTASVTIPRKIKLDGKPIAAAINSTFNRGDAVKIELGYYPNLLTVFEGFISKVHPRTPIVIDCEDGMFRLKQSTFTFPQEYTTITKDKNGKLLKTPKKSYREISLTELLDAIKTAINSDIVIKNIAKVESLGHIRFSDVTPAKALEWIKEQYGIYSYFVGDVLNVGLPSDASDTNTEDIVFEKQVIRENMEYLTADNMRLKIVCKSIDSKTNVRVEGTAGDEDGEVRTFNYLNLTEAECTAHAENLLVQRKYTGYQGGFLTFGEPYLRHGDAANLIRRRKLFEENDGVYSIKSVERVFGMGGYRQNIELGILLSE